jgi:hypothetical protein
MGQVVGYTELESIQKQAPQSCVKEKVPGDFDSCTLVLGRDIAFWEGVRDLYEEGREKGVEHTGKKVIREGSGLLVTYLPQ